MKISAPDQVAGWLCGLPPQTQQRVRLALGGWADGKGDIKSAFPLTKPEPPVGDWEIAPLWGLLPFSVSLTGRSRSSLRALQPFDHGGR